MVLFVCIHQTRWWDTETRTVLTFSSMVSHLIGEVYNTKVTLKSVTLRSPSVLTYLLLPYTGFTTPTFIKDTFTVL